MDTSKHIQVGDLAIVIKGLWPNVGRVVYVKAYRDLIDFSAIGLLPSAGWLVRSVSATPLTSTEGECMTGITPVASLRRINPLSPELMRQIHQQMAIKDFKEAMNDLAQIVEHIEEVVECEVVR